MPRALTSAMIRALGAEETGEVAVMLVTITGASLPTPIRVTSQLQDFTSRGEVFTAFPFRFEYPTDSDEEPGVARLVLDNVSRELVDEVREVREPLDVLIENLLASQPDTVEDETAGLKLRNVTGDVSRIEGELTFEDLVAEPFPAGRFWPSKYPGLF